jgi:hypothetical protein
LAKKANFKWRSRGANRMDFARGVAEVVEALGQKRPSRLSARFSLHINEIALALSLSEPGGQSVKMTTRCDVPAPMPWAT